MGGKGGQTIGYHYIMSVFSGLGRGPINEIVEIRVDEKQAWTGSVTDATPQKINKPNLFGGEEREGGIQGAFRLFQGDADQVLPGSASITGIGARGPVTATTIKSLASLIGEPISEMRGFASLLFDGLVTSISPYPRAWEFRQRRWDEGWFTNDCWYPAKAKIALTGDGAYANSVAQPDPTSPLGVLIMTVFFPPSGDEMNYVTSIAAMNPAHIIYQALTDPDWGAGESPESIDQNSFTLAANTLCSEAFGLCLNWTRQEDVQPFIQVVIDHIGAVVYNDRETGKFVLRLLRGDYIKEDLPHYTPSTGLLAIEEDDNASAQGSINEVVIKGHDPVLNKPFQVRVQNLGAIQAEGKINSTTTEYKGCPTRALAIKLAQRELRMHAAGFKRYKLMLDRRAWKIAPGMPIRISDPSRGIFDVVVRLGEVDYGALDKGKISTSCVEDMFAYPASTFGVPVVSSWSPPQTLATPALVTRLIEAGYRDLYLQIGAAGMVDVEDTSSYIGQLAAPANPVMYQYDLLTKVSGETNFQTAVGKPFSGFTLLSDDVLPLDTVLPIMVAVDLNSDNIGDALLINDEIVELEGISTSTCTVKRGCADTIPSAHSSGSIIWSIDDDLASDAREFALGETVTSKVLTRTGSDVLDEAEAVAETVDLVGRHALPFLPGDVKVDGDSIYSMSGQYPEPVFSWSHRDRILQGDQLVGHVDSGGVAPEPDSSVRLRIYSNPENVLLRTEAGVTGTGFTYDATMQSADTPGPTIRVVIDAQRDAFDSWKNYDFVVHLDSGYGFEYGRNYGGAL